LHEAFKPNGLILTAAVAAGIKYIKSAYELSEIHGYLDFINLMAYGNLNFSFLLVIVIIFKINRLTRCMG
jgi:hypothetical protein